MKFDFDNFYRNEHLKQLNSTGSINNKLLVQNYTKTGTTIVGLVYKDGVILGADTRATNGPIVADKNCAKIHYISDNIYCCGAGTASDTEHVTEMISLELHLNNMNNNMKYSKLNMALTKLKQHLFKYQGHIGAALILGGIDINENSDLECGLYTIYPHGSTDKLPFVTMGSGSLAAMSVFESKYRPDLSEEEGIELVSEAIEAGIFNDLGSGSNVDICIISKNRIDQQNKDSNDQESIKTKMLRNYKMPNKKKEKTKTYKYRTGITPILKEHIFNLVTVSSSQVSGSNNSSNKEEMMEVE